MLGNLSKGIVPFKVADALTDGKDLAAAESSTAINCSGYDRLMVIYRTGANVANGAKITIYVKEADAADGQFEEIDGSKLIHTAGASGETNMFHIVDVKLGKPFVKVGYQRETQNSDAIAVWGFLYDGKKLPVDAPAEVKSITVV
jgi:hypothetical protein